MMTKRRVRGLARAVEVGERVFLRFPTARDEAEYVALLRASRAFLKPWRATIPGVRDHFGPEIFRRVLKSSRDEAANRFLVCGRESGEIMGGIDIGGMMRGAFNSAFVGYWLGEQYAGQGYMSEALTLALHHAFKTLKLHRVEANIVPANRPSKKLVRRHGFRFEGLAKRYLKIAGKWSDHEHWAMTVEEWVADGT